jgi:phosphoribosylglycinamide formyltransferase 1
MAAALLAHVTPIPPHGPARCKQQLRGKRFGPTTGTKAKGDPMPKKRVAILISGRGANMAALIAAAKKRDYPAEIAVVLSNRPAAAGLAHAGSAGIPTAIVDHTEFGEDREGFERAVQAVLEAHRIEIVCLAGFLRVFTPWMVSRWSGRMINIHPALLPSFKGLHTHERAIEAGVKIHGASVHFVVPDVDAGPIIAQAAVPVLDDDTSDALAARVLAAELRLYPLALRLVAAGRSRIAERDTVHNAAAVLPTAQLIVPDPD